jgi:hypothetical protein
MKNWEIIADNLSKADLRGSSQPVIGSPPADLPGAFLWQSARRSRGRPILFHRSFGGFPKKFSNPMIGFKPVRCLSG